MKMIIRILVIILMIGFIAYFGMCVYSNFFSPEATAGQYDMPSSKEAAYSLLVKNTATVILTDDCEVFGSDIGSRTFYLTGYWELRGSKFEYVDATLSLPEQVFGEIIMKRR